MSDLTPEQFFVSYRGIIPQFDAFCRKLYEPLPLHLRINTLKASLAEIPSLLAGRGVLFEREESMSIVLRVLNISHPGHLLEFALGQVHSQALSSVLAALALEPKPDDVVLDICAAPGSKTTLLAQLMGNKGIIVANDKNVNRLVALLANCKRLGVTNTITTCYAGQHLSKAFTFDRVLVDVPCTSEGKLRAGRNNLLRISTQLDKRLPALQRDLVLRAFDLLRPGGTLVYSTCTYNPDENEGVVQFLLENRQARIQPIHLKAAHSPGIDEWQEITYDSSLRHCWRIYPHQLDTVGFFLARVDKGA